MCGVAGLLDASCPRDLWFIASAMGETLRYRGPDGDGVWVDATAGIALAHRRLAILDLSPNGHQPMRSSSGRYVLTYNGEIYNFAALRDELGSTGHSFVGGSDTEVLLAAFERWGVEGALRRANGMFAFALWDAATRTLHLARDRIGKKPLYYGWAGSAFVFGSELKALRAHPAFDSTIDRGSLALFLRYRQIPSPYCIYRRVRKLPPGTVVTLRADAPAGTMTAPVAYWSAAELSGSFDGGEADAIDTLEELLLDATRLRMVADVPVGAFLSGGIDSSAVAALMQRVATGAVRTFSIGSEDALYDEARYARRVAQHLGTDHTELIVTARDAMDVIPLLPQVYDEPFADSSQIPTYLVSRLARSSVTVALSGDGGDELFAGYNRHVLGNAAQRAGRIVPKVLRGTVARALTRVPPHTWDSLFRFAPRPLRVRMPGDKLHKLASLLALDDSAATYMKLVSHWDDPASVVLDADEPPTAASCVGHALPDRMQLLDLIAYLPDDILTKVDRASMAVGLEVRAPLLDIRVLEFAWSLPRHLKIRDGRGKYLLRRLLARYVPEELVNRPKAGFGIPIYDWLRGPLRGWAEELLDADRLRHEALLDPGPIRLKWEEHLSGRRNWQYHLWDVLMFESWLEHQHSDVAAA